MKVCGIVAEYNPFHNGHLWHLNESLRVTSADKIIIVMSGNFTQRGEPAICDKFARTKMALLNGADLILEMPVYYASASAEFFAKGAIAILDGTNITDYICFGSESGDLRLLQAAAERLVNETLSFKAALAEMLKTGISYPKARGKAIAMNLQSANDMSTSLYDISEPNDILAVEYLKALNILGSDIKPFTIKRAGTGYHSGVFINGFASASAIRTHILASDYDGLPDVMPDNALSVLKNEIAKRNAPNFANKFSDILHYILSVASCESLKNISSVCEGLENRLLRCSFENGSVSDIAKAMKTKRYTLTRINRIILNTILNITKNDFEYFNDNGGPQYIRVLGFKKESEGLLKQLCEKAKLPVVTNLKNATKTLDAKAYSMLAKEIETTNMYYSPLMKDNAAFISELSKPLVII